MRGTLLWFITAWVGLSPLRSQVPTPQDLSPLLQEVIAHAHIPGVAAMVLRGDQVIAQGVAGVRQRRSNIPVTWDDQWEIASGSKAITATALRHLMEQGVIHWNASLESLFGTGIGAMHPGWHEVTLAQLLSHTSGARDQLGDFFRLAGDSDGDLVAQRRAYVTAVLSHPPPKPAGATFHYCNTNYLIAAAAAELRTGNSIEELLCAEVFDPMALTSAGFGPPGTPGQTDQPWGHGSRRVRYLPLPFTGNTPFDPGSPQADYPAAANPTGRVHLSLPDWARFAVRHLRGDAANPFHRPGVDVDYTALHTAFPGTDYAAGWYTGERPWAKGSRPGDTGRILYHPADNGRWNCVIYLAPEIDLAVLIVCNRGGMWKPIDRIAGTLVTKFASSL